MIHDQMQHFIDKKYRITYVKLQECQAHALKWYLSKQRVQTRANTKKLLQRWIPTNEILHRQQRQHSPKCTRCNLQDETAHHILVCPCTQATEECSNLLNDTLSKLVEADMPQAIAVTMEEQMGKLLQIKIMGKYNRSTLSYNKKHDHALSNAICHRNLLGWENLLYGYASKFWITSYFITKKA